MGSSAGIYENNWQQFQASIQRKEGPRPTGGPSTIVYAPYTGWVEPFLVVVQAGTLVVTWESYDGRG